MMFVSIIFIDTSAASKPSDSVFNQTIHLSFSLRKAAWYLEYKTFIVIIRVQFEIFEDTGAVPSIFHFIPNSTDSKLKQDLYLS
ncbi:hypothetical protein DYBT9275_04247 [Dyadobacter sp. CECT 9275]|uniref:Uncharacterized protein n=1 Tax=Dyadobacter helix TaxID=2822344 RepID=A0A916NMR8_9BACT|nr:hypothetical protein DYBT9275_04247 [Dyadobacter sp. CECT 9275]